jgi:hypothetical protein
MVLFRNVFYNVIQNQIGINYNNPSQIIVKALLLKIGFKNSIVVLIILFL